MKLPVIAVYDKKCGLFDNPFVVRHTGEAVREWNLITKNTETKFGKNPEDFTMVEIGTFDASLGKFENLQPHTQLA